MGRGFSVYTRSFMGCGLAQLADRDELSLTSYLPMLLKKHMLTDPIIFEIIIFQNQHN